MNKLKKETVDELKGELSILSKEINRWHTYICYNDEYKKLDNEMQLLINNKYFASKSYEQSIKLLINKCNE